MELENFVQYLSWPEYLLTHYNMTKVSIQRHVLLNDLVRIFQKSLYQSTRSKSISKKWIVLVYLCTCLQSLLNILFWIFGKKKSLLNNQYYLFIRSYNRDLRKPKEKLAKHHFFVKLKIIYRYIYLPTTFIE